MQLSPYLTSHRHPSIPGQVLLFSTKTGALVLLPEEDFQALNRGDQTNAYGAELTKLEFLVADREAEYRAMQGYMEAINRDNPNLTLAIVPGMECNFRCSYCFEGQQKGAKAMDDPTSEQLVAFIKKRFRPGKKKLILQFYGGEPLLYTRQILALARRLKPFVEEQGAALVLDLISNGSLLSPELVAELTPWGLDGVKVTLDGPPANHDRLRPFKSGAGSFAVIVDRLARICTQTKIRLGGNYTRESYQDFATVLDLLAERGISPERVEGVSFNMVMQVSDPISASDYRGGCSSINEPWLGQAALHVRREVLKRGYPVAELQPEPCGVEMDDAYTVHYDGSLYKCITWVGHEQYRIGDIWQGLDRAYQRSHHLFHWQREEECQRCRYLPLCFGGCRYMAYQRDGHMGRVDCRRPFFEANLETMLLQDLCYRYGQIEEQDLEA
ncbi:geopeptide radical SAM maturase [Desulfogranum mediterraneum]|uniref:geopeptide radical SAM maturase n=1 Tax=Desulfogranum mediterraneum TaxID=160661 RepID=UPI000422FA93|nr:geopeptide radical SAM maturase [Desulfogranum mediterraneum]